MTRLFVVRTFGLLAASLLVGQLLLPAAPAGAGDRGRSTDAARAHAFVRADGTARALMDARSSGRSASSERRPTAAGLRLRSGDSADDLTSRSECYIDSYDDSLDGSDIDVADYGMLYECEFAHEWAFLIRTADSWSSAELDVAALHVDADGQPSTGCGGFEHLLLAFEDTTGLTAALFRRPSCDASQATHVRDVEVVRTTSQNLAIFFDNRLIGDPDSIVWAGDVSARTDTTRDDLPDSGYHQARDFKSPVEACTTASRGYMLSSDDSRARTVLREAGATSIRQAGKGILTFDGSVAVALGALRRAGIEGRVESNDLMKRMAAPDDLGSSQWAPSHVSAAGAWDLTRGSSEIAVGVIDSGIDATHPDLAGKVLPGYDAYAGQALPGGNSDRDGHGTSVASVIGAATDNGDGIAGLGWNTPVVAIRPDDPEGNISAAAVASAIRWGADTGLRVLNISLGSCVHNQAVADAVAYALRRNVVIVASSGNSAEEGNPVNYPAAFEGVIGVGATGFSGSHAPYSNTGSYVDIVAPGGSAGADADLSHGMLVLAPAAQVRRVDGTSFSAPMVAAGAALVLSVNPQLTRAQVADILVSTATDRGAAGRDDTYGAGMLNLERAVRTAGALVTPAPSPSPTSTASAAPSPTSSSPAAPAPANAVPSVTADPFVVRFGQTADVTITGTPGATVDLYIRKYLGQFVKIRDGLVLDSSGRTTVTTRPDMNLRFMARDRTVEQGSSIGGADGLMTVEKHVSINVQRVGVNRFTFSGSINPMHAGAVVHLYRNGSLIKPNIPVNSSRVYSTTVTLPAGAFGFRVTSPTTGYNNVSHSLTRTVRIY